MEFVGALTGAIFAYRILAKQDKEDEIYESYQNAYNQFELGNFKEALKLLKIQMSTSTPRDYHILLKGRIKFYLKKYKSACKNFQNAIDLYELCNDEYADTYYYMGESKSIMGDYENAIKDFDTSIHYIEIIKEDKFPAIYKLEYWDYLHPHVFAKRGEANLELERFKFAICDFKNAIDLGIDNPSEIYQNLGYAKFKLNQYANAIEDFNRAINLGLNHILTYLYRGCAKYKLGDFQDAIDDFEKVIEINPTHYNHEMREFINTLRECED